MSILPHENMDTSRWPMTHDYMTVWPKITLPHVRMTTYALPDVDTAKWPHDHMITWRDDHTVYQHVRVHMSTWTHDHIPTCPHENINTLQNTTYYMTICSQVHMLTCPHAHDHMHQPHEYMKTKCTHESISNIKTKKKCGVHLRHRQQRGVEGDQQLSAAP